jgi:hypothetical protein
MNLVAMFENYNILSPCHAVVARSGTIESFIFSASYDRMYQSLRENENKWTVDGRVVKFSTVLKLVFLKSQ